MKRFGLVGSAAVVAALLALTACSEEETVQAPPEPPAAGDREQPGTAEDGTSDTAEELGEAAEALRDEAGRLAEEARKRAEEALENAGPALERVGEAAQRLGQSVSEILDKAASDLEKLNAELGDQSARPETELGDPEAILPPVDQLNADTRAAARAFPAGAGPDYVGVWAADPASCAKIDQEPLEIFAVITPTTIRRYESVCNIPTEELSNGSVTLTASCVGEGTTEERPITLTMSSPANLTIAQGEGTAGVDLVRCRLPE